MFIKACRVYDLLQTLAVKMEETPCGESTYIRDLDISNSPDLFFVLIACKMLISMVLVLCTTDLIIATMKHFT